MIPILKKVRSKFFKQRPGKINETEPVQAYNAWSETYDAQPDNLMLALDEKLFSDLASEVNLAGKIIADIGCGTGRHWQKLMDEKPAAIFGYDTSPGMLDKLNAKYPEARIFLLNGNMLTELKNESCDVIISTLTLAHIEQIDEAVAEWHRVLKTGGAVVLTDYHPAILAKGGSRTFKHKGKTMAVQSHIHEIPSVLSVFENLGFEKVSFTEQSIDDTMKFYYEKQNALATFERFKGVPLIYGIHLRKKNAASKSATD